MTKKVKKIISIEATRAWEELAFIRLQQAQAHNLKSVGCPTAEDVLRSDPLVVSANSRWFAYNHICERLNIAYDTSTKTYELAAILYQYLTDTAEG